MGRTPRRHTVTIRQGPDAGQVLTCDCSRTRDHFLEIDPTHNAWKTTHPTLF